MHHVAHDVILGDLAHLACEHPVAVVEVLQLRLNLVVSGNHLVRNEALHGRLRHVVLLALQGDYLSLYRGHLGLLLARLDVRLHDAPCEHPHAALVRARLQNRIGYGVLQKLPAYPRPPAPVALPASVVVIALALLPRAGRAVHGLAAEAAVELARESVHVPVLVLAALPGNHGLRAGERDLIDDLRHSARNLDAAP